MLDDEPCNIEMTVMEVGPHWSWAAALAPRSTENRTRWRCIPEVKIKIDGLFLF
jgi:hypothetical protein